MPTQYKNDAMASIHEMMDDLYSADIIDKQTMREFDALCLTPVTPLSAEEICAIREREHVSQSVFAHYLNVSKSVISQWERGEKHPSGAALKLLSLIASKGLAVVA
jgi:putative transcriptional regulator